jgi:hypothetical protein
MDGVVEQLQPFLEVNPDSLSDQSMDILIGFSDFDNFKDMMMMVKADKAADKAGAGGEGAGAGEIDHTLDANTLANIPGLAPEVAQKMEEANKILGDGSEQAGWTAIYDKQGLKLQRNKVDGQNWMKTTVDLDMSTEHAENMFLNMGPDRKNWDDVVSGKFFDSF